MNQETISLAVTEAFARRRVVVEENLLEYKIEDSIDGWEIRLTFEIYRGRTWQEIADLLREERNDSGSIYDFCYLSSEEFAYYLPAFLLVGMENAPGSLATREHLEWRVDPHVHGVSRWKRWVALLTTREIECCISALAYIPSAFPKEYLEDFESEHVKSALKSLREYVSP